MSTIPEELADFPFRPARFESGLPVYDTREAYRRLFSLFGIPNAITRPGDDPFFGGSLCLFVDDHNDGKQIAYFDHKPSTEATRP